MTEKANRVLVVGAGFAGAVHARVLAESGVSVTIIDKRNHVAGNAYDAVDGNGIMVHRYGPHLFHTANKDVIAWIKGRGEWASFTHRVRARLDDGSYVPIPINRTTVNRVFRSSHASEEDVIAYLAAISVTTKTARNAAEHLNSRIGVRLTDLFFRPYTRKMWGLDLEDLAPAIVKRIPLRFDNEDTYFPSGQCQLLPIGGYNTFFEKLLDHRLIDVCLNSAFDRADLKSFSHCFASSPIDEFYDFSEGELAYRSIRFHHRSEISVAGPKRDSAVTNFTDDGPFTRETAWHVLPNHLVIETGRRTYTCEEPCDYRENGMERYYPVKTADGANDLIYQRYVERSKSDGGKMTFIGRCGTYRYLDMDQVISQSLASVRGWLSANNRRAA